MQRKRKQNGTIVCICGRWYLRFYEKLIVNGQLVRKRASHLLGPKVTRGKSVPDPIKQEAERFMLTINNSEVPPDQVVTVHEYMESVYLPWIDKSRKPATGYVYRLSWKSYLKPVIPANFILKDVRTRHVQTWLDQIGKNDLARNTISRTKAVLGGAFKRAIKLNYLSPPNPAHDVDINPQARKPVETPAYSEEEVADILSRLPEPAATVFSIAAYAGLRRSEIEALHWEDYHDGHLHVERNISAGVIVSPKSKASKAAVPVISALANKLEAHRFRAEAARLKAQPDQAGEPTENFMFTTSVGTRLPMANVIRRMIIPSLNRCRHCGHSEGKDHLKSINCPGYERDNSIPEWLGLHSARRSLGSRLYRLGIKDKQIQKVLRHSDLNTTLTYYVRVDDEDAQAAMDKLDSDIAQTAPGSLTDTEGTVTQAHGQTAKLVN